MWECSCQCGGIKIAKQYRLTTGVTRSCGCITRDRNRAMAKHNLSKTPIYYAWRSMLKRCYNQKSSNYHLYGGRGISVCLRWHQSVNFLSDMLPSWKAGLQLDRIDNNGNYEPKNCRWATCKIQSNNRRNTWLIECNGIHKTASEWSEISGVNGSLIKTRIKRGWSNQRACFEKAGKYKRF